jgi:viroplasmin and RNaseH domain-containing protein
VKSDRWYEVVVGHNPRDTGVYKDFANVDPLVTGVSGAVFRGPFETKAEAESYLSSMVSLLVAATPSRQQKWYVVLVGQDPTNQGVYRS